ncbi:MAG: ComEC/Rec2 family competence protein [Nitriliruptoraceae bacterium]
MTARLGISAVETQRGEAIVWWLAHGRQPLVWLMSGVVIAGIAVLAGAGLSQGHVAVRWASVRQPARIRFATPLMATVMVAVVIAMGMAARAAATSGGPLVALADRGGTATIVAKVVREPRLITTGWQVVVRVTTLDGQPVRQRAALTIHDDPPALGTTWHGAASARPLPDGGYGRWLRTQHVVAILDPMVWDQADDAGWLAATSEHVRQRVRQSATRLASERVGGLLVGFVIGDTRLLPDDDAAAMRATSLTHLTAVSGTNVGIVAAGVLAITIAAGCSLRARWMVVGVVIVWFAFVTRFEPSVMRAGTMALIVLMVRLRGQIGDARHSLATAVLVLILVDPHLAGSLGLTLSAAATAGVLVIAPLVLRRLDRWPKRLAQVAAITVGAQIAVLPVVLLTFGEMGVASVPANVVAVPAAMIAATVSFVGSAVALVSVEAASVLFWIASWPARIVLVSAHAFADVAGLARWDRPATVVALVAAAAWVVQFPGTPRARWTLACAGAATMVALIPVAAGALPARDFSVSVIDVGQGDALLVESPGARVMVDAGSDDTAARWLRANGRRRLDLVVVTHPHLDHVGGVADVIRSVRVGQVWYRPQPNALPQVDDFLAEAQARDIDVVVPITGSVVTVGDLVIEVLHPPSGRPYRFERSELNEMSTVLKITYVDGRRVLLTGDVERAGQRDLLSDAPARLEAELITVPHHGAATTEFDFLAATGAQIGMISVGHDNTYGHPHPDVLALLAELDIEVVRSDRDGSTTVVVPERVGPDRFGPDRFGPDRRNAPANGLIAGVQAPALQSEHGPSTALQR